METGFEALAADFAHDALGLVSKLEEELLRVETASTSPERNAAAQAARRILHTLKGNAGLVGANLLKTAIHRLEDGATELATRPDQVDALLLAVDVLRAELQSMAQRPDPDDATDAVRALAAGVAVQEIQAREPRVQDVLTVRAAHADDLIASAAEVSVLVRQLQLAITRSGADRTVAQLTDRLAAASRALHADALKIRSVSVRQLLQRYERMARDEARAQSKKVAFRVEAVDLRADKSVLDGLVGALSHLVRNAVTHGLEPPEKRAAAGKPETGTITLRAEPAGARLRFVVEDDGAGLDHEKVRRRAAELGMPSSLPVDELIFEAGFSTAETTEAAGRGVGLEAVRRDVQRLGGRISVRSEPGRGTAFEMIVPATLALERGLVFGIGESRFAVPIAHVEEAVPVSTLKARQGQSRRLFEHRGRLVPVVAPPLLGAKNGDLTRGHAVFVHFGRAAAFVVDHLGEQQELVFEPLAPDIRGRSLVSGAALAPDGGIILRLDTEALVRAAHAREARA
ncbi:MAG: chemotaxis protein CheW [Myxococcaceae bacterium]|nr:chemotaxis protein CheW [Myxococcaceae bacterium]